MAKTKPARIETPDGYDSVDDFLADVRQRFQQGTDADRLNREAGMDDLKFLSGDQWDATQKKQRIKNRRPCLTINRLPQFVGQVAGDIRINQPAIKVRPAEDADKDLAEVREGLIRSIEYQSGARGVYINAGEDQVGCGIGNFRCELVYADNDAFDQDIRIQHIPNPFAVVWDPMSVERTGADARYCFIVDEVPRKVFEKRYPNEAPSTLDVTTCGPTWITSDVVKVTEYWVIKETPRTIALLTDGSIKDITGREDEFAAQIAVDERTGQPRKRVANKRTACMYITTGHALLEPAYELPLTRLPVFRVMGREVRVGDARMRYGLVRFAKDPARLNNIWRSVAAEVLAAAPRGKWLVHETEEGDQQAFRDAATDGEGVLPWSGTTKPEWLEPPAAPSAVLQEAALSAQDMKDVTGLHDASLGAQSNETSGKAIMARERQGDVATYMYHDNLNAAIEACGKVVNDLIPIVYDTARTIRVIGVDETAAVKRINDPNDPDSIDLGKGKYDIIVETGPSYSTKRVEAAEALTEFVRAFPMAGQLAGDLIAKAQDWPFADEMAERLKRAIPPQILGPDKEGEGGSPAGPPAPPPGPPPPPPIPPEVQAAQIAQLGADTQIKEANARKAQADAITAEANAELARLKLNQAGDQFDQMITGKIAEALQALTMQGHITAGPRITGQPAPEPPAPTASPQGAPPPMPPPQAAPPPSGPLAGA